MKSRIVIKVFTVLALIGYALPVFSNQSVENPPTGYDSYTSGIPHGTTEVVSYFSTTVGVYRKTRVMLPPDYSTDKKYNVLYLLHGIGGNIDEWYYWGGVPNYILDNLYASGKVEPMIVVLPNGRAMEDDSPGDNIYAVDKVAGFERFEVELINDLIPFISEKYSVNDDREARAIAGLSMGAGQTLNFGLAHLDYFAHVGAFSPAPNTKAADLLIPDIANDTSKISTLWLSCGDADGLLWVTQNVHNYWVQHKVEHDYWIQPGKGHDFTVWKPGLYQFALRIFKNATVVAGSKNNDGNEPAIVFLPNNQKLELSGLSGICQVHFYDIAGVLKVTRQIKDSGTIDIQDLPNGIYMVEVINESHRLQTKILKY